LVEFATWIRRIRFGTSVLVHVAGRVTLKLEDTLLLFEDFVADTRAFGGNT